MKKNYKILLTTLILIPFVFSLNAQSFDGDWTVDYATNDDGDNGTGIQTISVAASEEDAFTALVTSWEESCYLVGYREADSSHGRLGEYPYNEDGLFMAWAKGFTFIQMFQAHDLVNDGDIIYVANNDEEHNILSFELQEDSVYSYSYRMPTGSESIWGIDKDDNGYFYVTQGGDDETPGKILVFEGPAISSEWEDSNPSLEPITEFEIPTNGSLRGIAVNSSGSVVYVSNFHERKVYCYTGSPQEGYQVFENFEFQLTNTFTASSQEVYEPSPFGLQYINEKNILFASVDLNDDSFDYTGDFVEYGKILALNPNNGDVLDTIDIAEWNFNVGGYYTNTSPGTSAGYASAYNLDYDTNFNLYNVSMWGWSVEKRSYSESLPNFELTIDDSDIEAEATINITALDGVGNSQELILGQDPNATDGLDEALGEYELPPMPPTGVFDARLVLPNDLSSPVDIREGDMTFANSTEFEVQWQLGEGSEGFTLEWNLPGDITMTMQDFLGGVVVNETFGPEEGSYTITNENLSSLKLTFEGVVPVELSSFTGNATSENVQLEWITSSEKNNSGFEVQRSEDNENFTKIGFVDGNGTTTEKQEYSYVDNSVQSGTYYYRLKQIDLDGSYEYSGVVEVEMAVPQEFSLEHNYPNPFNPTTTIKFGLPVQSDVTVRLFNSLGQEVKELISKNYSAGVHTFKVDASSLSSGIYFYSIEANGKDGSNFVKTRKMLLIK